jgi:hypothetical protein
MNESHQHSPPGEGHGHAEHEHGLAHEFLEKLISLRSMDPGLLVLTVLAMAMVVAAGILIMVKGLPWPQVRATSDIVAQTIPLPVMVGCAVFVVLAWSYILSGALHSHVVVRLIGMVLWTLGNLTALSTSTSFYGWIADGLLFAVAWAMAITMYLVDRFYADKHTSGWHHRFRLRVSTFLFFAVVTGLLFTIGSLSGLHNGSFGFALSLQLQALQFVLIPMLYLAGTDFAEWSEVVAGRVGSIATRAGGRLATWVLAGLVVIAVGLILAERIDFVTLRGAAILIGESMIPLGLMTVVGVIAMRRRAAARIPFYALVVVALVGYGTMIGGSVLSCALGYCSSGSESEYVEYTHEEPPVFTLSYDKSWHANVERIPGGEGAGGETEAVVFGDTDSSGLPVRFAVLEVADARGVEDPLTTAVPALMRGTVTVTGAPREQGEWQVRTFSLTSQGTEYDGRAWTRAEGRKRWLLTGVSPLVAGGAHDEVFSHMVSTWEPKAAGGGGEAGQGGQAASDTQSGPSQFAFNYTAAPFLWLAVFIGSALLIRRGGVSASAGLFMITGGIFYLGYGVRYLFALFLGGKALELPLPWWILPPDMENTIAAAAVWVLIGLVALLVTGRLNRAGAPLLRLMLVLLLGLVGLRLVYEQIFGTALTAGHGRPAIQAIVLMLALLWDVAMSGENLTNREGDRVPRHSRVLMYFGYTMLVATAVLFFSSLQGPGAEEHEFESDQWPQLGIQLMGVPLVLTFFFANLGIWLRRRRSANAPPPDPSPDEEAPPQPAHPGLPPL